MQDTENSSDPTLMAPAGSFSGSVSSVPAFDVEAVRRDFPILEREVHGQPLVYLDSAATAQTPRSVVQALSHFDEQQRSNIHRGVHWLSEQATVHYEQARDKVREFLGAQHREEIIFVRGTTEAINLVARTWGARHVGAGDEIIVSGLEHHSNIVPWQMLCEEKGASLRVIPLLDDGSLDMSVLPDLFSERTRLVAVTQTSNALGTVTALKKIIDMAHDHDVPVLVDGAQAVPHGTVDVQALGCDFYAFSGHKLYGPTGIGVLYGKRALLDAMPPFHGGGDMILHVTFEKSTYAPLPCKFEAGTPNIAGAIGLGAAIDYVTGLGRDAIAAHEAQLLKVATEALSAVDGLRMIGTAPQKVAVCSFTLDGVHPHDMGTILDRSGIAIRAGHHCAQPVMERFGVPATVRASFGLYNTRDEIDALVRGLHHVLEVFKR